MFLFKDKWTEVLIFLSISLVFVLFSLVSGESQNNFPTLVALIFGGFSFRSVLKKRSEKNKKEKKLNGIDLYV